MLGVAELDLMEACSVLSSIGTLALAVTAWYQIRRDTKLMFVPMVVIDDFAWSGGNLVAQIRNYGTGPALDIKLWMMEGQDAAPVAPLVDGRQVTGLHLAPAEAKRVVLTAHPRCREQARAMVPAEIRMRYHSVRGRTYEERTRIPQELQTAVVQHGLGQADDGLPE
ncbi:hypothetical protein [Alicyclobacillus sendaiensis]|uniref:hypothetical protein n=1 Tax=Alicyclobacillus sendaiensis TaxID=192387 RepID=UPI00078397AA|nr:hypothetical protein [Alicyclobacillus sendaiensis]